MYKLVRVQKNKTFVCILNIIFIAVLALISVLPAFLNHAFFVSFDAGFHLERFENIYFSLKAGEMPNLFVFHSVPANSTPGVATNAMYPWLTTLIFVLPRFLTSNALLWLAAGFFVLNFITIMNAKFLANCLSKNPLYIWLGVIVYQFNNFHFIDLYSRVSMGESIAYAFFPLVILGMIKIHQNEGSGKWILGIGMGLIVNSHVLTLLLSSLFVGAYEIFRLIKRRLTLKNVIELFKAASITVGIGFFSLYNIISIYANNKIFSPAQIFYAIDPWGFVNKVIENDLAEQAFWTYGLPLVMIQIVLTIVLIVKKEQGSWSNWLLGADFLILSLFYWFPWGKLTKTPIAIVQFLSRLEIFVVAALMVAIVLYYSSRKISRSLVFVTSFALIFFSTMGTYQNQVKLIEDSNNTADVLKQDNYDALIQNRLLPWDYLPVDSNGQKYNVDQQDASFQIKKQISENNGMKYDVDLSEKRYIVLPMIMYKDFTYNIQVDGHKVDSTSPYYVRILVNNGYHHVSVEVKNSRNIIPLMLTVLTFVISLFYLTKVKINKKLLILRQ